MSLVLASLSFAGDPGNAQQAMESAQVFAHSLEGKHALRGDQGCADIEIVPSTHTSDGHTFYDIWMNGSYAESLFHPYADTYKVDARNYEFFDKKCTGVIGVSCRAVRVRAKKDKQGLLETLQIKRYDYAVFGWIRTSDGTTECHR